MDSSKKYVNKSPEEKAGVISTLFYVWFLPFFKFGYQNDIQLKHVYNSTKNDLSGLLGDALQKNWEAELRSVNGKKPKKPSLRNAIRKTFWLRFAFYGFGMFIQFGILRMTLPLVLAKFISFFDTKENPHEGWIWGSGVILMSFSHAIISHSARLASQRIGMRVRISVCSLVYRKLLRLSHSSLGETAAGQLVNLLSNDVQRFDFASTYMHMIWIMPILAIISFTILCLYVGVITAVAGMLFIILESIPLQGMLSKWQGKLRYKIAHKTDKRVKLMSEITLGIQVIKMYAWEKPFEQFVALSRKYEINVISKTSYCFGIISSMGVFTERVILFVTVITYVLLGGRLTSDIAFSLAQLYNTVQVVMAILFPMGLSAYSESKVSITRIEQFLMLEENEDKKNRKEKKLSDIGDIKITDAVAKWNKKSIVPTLMNVNLHIKPGTLCCVVGNVGCGKSSLLQLLLKELRMSQGEMEISGKIAYASQEPWLFVSSVRKNILFGKPMDKNRYQNVVSVCSLERDFRQLPYGDKTLVGERGTSLSGGQKARVNLARAVYLDADIYLLDDPLSAVDTKVGRHLFEECITKYLSGKTRILVTHQLQYMKEADLIVIINNGKIERVSTANEISENELNILNRTAEINDPEKGKLAVEVSEEKIEMDSNGSQFQSTTSIISFEDPKETEELITKGTVSTSTYLEYWRNGGGIFSLLFMCGIFIFAQIIANATDLWLTKWTNSEAKKYNIVNIVSTGVTAMSTTETTINASESTIRLLITASSIVSDSSLNSTATTLLNSVADSDTTESKEYYISIYSILIIASIVFVTCRSMIYYKICMTASRVLHDKMFNNILQAPMRFFDTNPSGRILNRFSKDMGAVDEQLPRCQIESLQIFCVMCGILVMVFIVSPWMIIPAVLLAPLYYTWRSIYLRSCQALKRLEGVTRAPVFSHVSASLYGITTIRASDAEDMVIKEFDALQDNHTGTYFSMLVSGAAFGFYLDVFSCIFLTIVTFQFLIFRTDNTLSGNVGLVISQCIILTNMVQYGILQSAEVVNNMISVERVLQYTKLDKEGPFESLPAKKPPRDWPTKGEIVYKNVYLRYAMNLPPVLKNLTINVASGEKIGIVGRTGAGKSTLISSLFRLAPIDGTILIDGIDTAEIGLTDLRSKISIIPQEPILFSASVRYNLDPLDNHNDDTLWEALENVELKDVINDLTKPVNEGGSNFSVGQRQLICLARAMVRKNKIIVMDEATANVDPRTDDLIQKTIRERFKDCTVLIIAHRLNTIMDLDKVLVMDNGQTMEFDHAHKLLQIANGYFSNMVKETGAAMEESLRAVAKSDYDKKITVAIE